MQRRARTKNKPGQAAEYLSGRNAVREALLGDVSRFNKLLLSKSVSEPFSREVRAAAGNGDLPVQTVPPQKLDRLLPGVNHQGVALSMSPVSYRSVHDLLTGIAPTLGEVRSRKPMILILDQIQDPHNLGAIIRTAVAVGAAGLILPNRNAASVNAAAMKTSAGTAHRIPIARAGSLSAVIQEMKERGYWIVGSDTHSDTTIWETDWDRPLAIVVGSEEKGMRKGIAGQCDFIVSIPLCGDVESLNASVAAGIVLAAAARSRVPAP
jgi:23S rRNA (guanosine2251-2'-O)-methyltransferase